MDAILEVNYKRKEIDEYPVIFFHRLFKKNYGDPSDIEWQDLRIDEKNGVPVIRKVAKEWAYYLTTDSGNIIIVSTNHGCKRMEIYIICSRQDPDDISGKIKDANKFIDALLKEAKCRGERFVLRDEIEYGENLLGFTAKNLFFSNYTCAELMIEWHNRIMPEILEEELIDHCPITSETPLTIVKRMEKYICTNESFIISGLLYYYMAIEAFINLIYEAFLLDEYQQRINKRKSTRNLGDRFKKLNDIEIKLNLMPHFCHGFKAKHFDKESEIYTNFLKLRDYRNDIIHGNIINSAKDVVIMDYPIQYQFPNDMKDKAIFPSKRDLLRKEHLLLAKNIVDEMIQDILHKMNNNTRNLVTKEIINEHYISYGIDKNGIMRLCKTETFQV